MNKTGMIKSKIDQFLNIIADRNSSLQKQQEAAKAFIASLGNKKFLNIIADRNSSLQKQKEAAKAFIASLGNKKVKQATQKIYNDVEAIQDIAMMILNKTEDAFAPLLGPNITMVRTTYFAIVEQIGSQNEKRVFKKLARK
ncbi:unnamed protein product [Strongylus vulgaris]|uniref:Uncharacterized protein n=1 Tax=Strongylus vulgaris TaxID=40348 RepID=A0A3P7JI75_STRVU|nr:unnamed protein product [Strongylus vulgaris]